MRDELETLRAERDALAAKVADHEDRWRRIQLAVTGAKGVLLGGTAVLSMMKGADLFLPAFRQIERLLDVINERAEEALGKGPKSC